MQKNTAREVCAENEVLLYRNARAMPLIVDFVAVGNGSPSVPAGCCLALMKPAGLRPAPGSVSV